MKDPDDPAFKDDPGLAQWRDFMANYLPDKDLDDMDFVEGYGVAMTLIQVVCPPPWPRQAWCPTRAWFGPSRWPFGQCCGARTIHAPAVERTNPPTPAATQVTLDRRTGINRALLGSGSEREP